MLSPTDTGQSRNDDVFRLGWRAYRAHLGDAVSAPRARRAVWIAVAATVVAVVLMATLEVTVHWTGTDPARATLAVALLSLGVGLVTFTCCPIARPVDPAATINGRQVRPDTARSVRTSVQPYLARRMPDIRPEDRDAVRTDTVLYRRGLIADLTKWTPLVVGGCLAALAAFVLGHFATFIPVWFVVYGANVLAWLHRLGRAERARVAAESLAPTPEVV